MKQGELQWTGFYLAGMVCLVLLVLKLTLGMPWSWWRVTLPLWTVLLHNALYVAVGFMWLTWMGGGREGDDLTIRRHHRLDRYQLVSLVCTLAFLDNVLRKAGGSGESNWWWLASGRTEVLLLSGAAHRDVPICILARHRVVRKARQEAIRARPASASSVAVEAGLKQRRTKFLAIRDFGQAYKSTQKRCKQYDSALAGRQ